MPTAVPDEPGIVAQIIEPPPPAVVEPEVAAGPTDEAIAYGLADRSLRLLVPNPDTIEFRSTHYVAATQTVCGEVRSIGIGGGLTAWMPFYYDIDTGHLVIFSRPVQNAEEARASVLIGDSIGCTVGTLGQR